MGAGGECTRVSVHVFDFCVVLTAEPQLLQNLDLWWFNHLQMEQHHLLPAVRPERVLLPHTTYSNTQALACFTQGCYCMCSVGFLLVAYNFRRSSNWTC